MSIKRIEMFYMNLCFSSCTDRQKALLYLFSLLFFILIIINENGKPILTQISIFTKMFVQPTIPIVSS